MKANTMITSQITLRITFRSSTPCVPLQTVCVVEREIMRVNLLNQSMAYPSWEACVGGIHVFWYRRVIRVDPARQMERGPATEPAIVGVSLGNPRLHVARENAMGAVMAEADRHATNVLPIIRESRKAGATTLRQIAEALNTRAIPSARGSANVLQRA